MVHLNMAPNPKAPSVDFSCTLCVGLWKPFMELVYCIPLDIGIVLHLLSLLQLANRWETHIFGFRVHVRVAGSAFQDSPTHEKDKSSLTKCLIEHILKAHVLFITFYHFLIVDPLPSPRINQLAHPTPQKKPSTEAKHISLKFSIKSNPTHFT